MSKKEQTPQGIEQIRDIIFGHTMGDYQERFNSLNKGIADLEKSFHKRMGELEKTLSELGEGWDNDVESIHNKMSADQKTLSDSIQKMRSQLMIKIRSIEEKGVARNDLARSLIALGQSLKDEPAAKGDVTISILEEQQ